MVQFIILLLVLVLVVFPLWAIFKILALARRQAELEWELRQLRNQQLTAAPPPAIVATPPPLASRPEPLPVTPTAPVAPPATPTVRAHVTPEPPVIAPPPVFLAASASPPVEPESVADQPDSLVARFNWEQFTGAKLLAWFGGLAAFLGLAFFVKYSFEHNLIPPEVRVTLGFLAAIGLVVGGLLINRDRYAVTAQTLIATGIVSLYGVTFACHSFYRFAVFQQHPSVLFALMVLITVTAFLLAVRLEARVVAILGILGGFLTPILLSTGQDNPPGLFGYLALLDAGLIAVALHRRWNFLVPLGAAGTALMQLAWAVEFFAPEKAGTAVVICLGFSALFLAAHLLARRLDRAGPETRWSAVALPFLALGFAFAFLRYPAIAARPGLLLGFVLAADAILLALAWFEDELPKLHLVSGLVVFALLGAWTSSSLTAELLPWALAFYLLHAALHTAFPLVLERFRPDTAPTWWSQLFPPLALLLMLGPLFKLEPVSLLLWPCVLLVDLLAIGLALVTASLGAVVVVLVLTLVATGVWIFHVPVAAAAAPSLLLVIGGFAVLFFAAGVFLVRQLGDQLDDSAGRGTALFGDVRGQIPAFSALLPFLLLIMMTQRLPLANPSPVFGLALLLIVLTLGLAAILTIEWLPACALAGVAALEFSWQARHLAADNAAIPLAWQVGFTLAFAAFPFVFRARFAALTGPWAVAALAGVLHFPLVYRLVERAWPNDFMGVLPVLFALPPLLSLVAVLRTAPADARARLNQLAWFGGVALLFITLVFPIQFDRQWITLGWALEGAALLWLFHRVPHPGLRATGAVLLVAAFARLALNPAVLHYHLRSETPLLNWYLYSFGLVTACLFVAARLVAPPRDRVLGVNAPPLFHTLGTVLAFLLVNVEIADFFSAPGTAVLTFQFTGNFARDMTYTIAWALFALGLLLVGIAKQLRPARVAALALLGAALLKLFFHDLARLEALYRVGALFAVAVIAIVASFAYQRFLPGNDKPAAPP